MTRRPRNQRRAGARSRQRPRRRRRGGVPWSEARSPRRWRDGEQNPGGDLAGGGEGERAGRGGEHEGLHPEPRAQLLGLRLGPVDEAAEMPGHGQRDTDGGAGECAGGEVIEVGCELVENDGADERAPAGGAEADEDRACAPPPRSALAHVECAGAGALEAAVGGGPDKFGVDGGPEEPREGAGDEGVAGVGRGEPEEAEHEGAPPDGAAEEREPAALPDAEDQTHGEQREQVRGEDGGVGFALAEQDRRQVAAHQREEGHGDQTGADCDGDAKARSEGHEKEGHGRGEELVQRVRGVGAGEDGSHARAQDARGGERTDALADHFAHAEKAQAERRGEHVTGPGRDGEQALVVRELDAQRHTHDHDDGADHGVPASAHELLEPAHGVRAGGGCGLLSMGPSWRGREGWVPGGGGDRRVRGRCCGRGCRWG